MAYRKGPLTCSDASKGPFCVLESPRLVPAYSGRARILAAALLATLLPT